MMNAFSRLKRYIVSWFAADDDLIDDEPTITYSIGSKRINNENHINEDVLAKKRKLSSSIDDDILSIEFPKPVLRKASPITMPRHRRNDQRNNTRKERRDNNSQIPAEIIEINDDEANQSPNRGVIEFDLTDSGHREDKSRNAKHASVPSSSSSSDVEIVAEYSANQFNKVENPPLREINNRHSFGSSYLMEPRRKGASTSSTSSSQSTTRSFKDFPSTLGLEQFRKDKDRRVFLSLLKQYAHSPHSARKSLSNSTSSTLSDTRQSTQIAKYSKNETSLSSRPFLTRAQDLSRKSFLVPSTFQPLPSTSQKHNASAIDKSVIDLTSEEDDDLQRQEIVSNVISSDSIKNLKTTFVGKDRSIVEEDYIYNILKKYDMKLQVKTHQANKIREQIRANQEDVNKTIAEILEKRLVIKEHEAEEEIEEQKPSFEIAPITKAMTAAVDQIVASRKVPLVQIRDTAIKVQDIRTLENRAWLNDEVINAYMNLIKMRAETKPDKYPKVHCFNTFLYEQLLKKGYNSVRRWTKKIDIFDYTMLIIPIHLGNHWCLIQIKIKEKCIRYFDSMGSPNNTCLKAMLQYLIDEYKDKKNGQLDPKEWQLVNLPPSEIPQQRNGYDCGVFACTFAEHLTRQAPFNFSQDHMPYFRVKMIYEILTGELLL